jgi:hypothetical protein
MKSGIRTWLLADATLKGKLATTTAVYSFPVPEAAALPYLFLSRVSAEIMNNISDSLKVYRETWQIDVVATTDAAAEELKELVIARMNVAGDRAAMGDYWVYACSFTGMTDNTALENEAGETAIIRQSLDFELLRNGEKQTA